MSLNKEESPSISAVFRELRDEVERLLLNAGLEPYDFHTSIEAQATQRLHVGSGEKDGLFTLKVNNTGSLEALVRLLKE